MNEVLGLMGFWTCLFGYIIVLIFVVPYVISKVADLLTGEIKVRGVISSIEEEEEEVPGLDLGTIKTGRTMRPIRRAARRGISSGEVTPMKCVTKVKRRK